VIGIAWHIGRSSAQDLEGSRFIALLVLQVGSRRLPGTFQRAALSAASESKAFGR
jgi:hypothetical protein